MLTTRPRLRSHPHLRRTRALGLALGGVAPAALARPLHAQTTTNCVPTYGGGLRCDTRPLATPPLAAALGQLGAALQREGVRRDAEARGAADARLASELAGARAQLFIDRAVAVRDAITDSLGLRGPVRARFTQEAYQPLLNLYRVNPDAPNRTIADALYPAARRAGAAWGAFLERLAREADRAAHWANVAEPARPGFDRAAYRALGADPNLSDDWTDARIRTTLGPVADAFRAPSPATPWAGPIAAPPLALSVDTAGAVGVGPSRWRVGMLWRPPAATAMTGSTPAYWVIRADVNCAAGTTASRAVIAYATTGAVLQAAFDSTTAEARPAAGTVGELGVRAACLRVEPTSVVAAEYRAAAAASSPTTGGPRRGRAVRRP